MTSRSSVAELLHELVSIPSVSGREADASRFLVGRMTELGYERSFVDDAGNAVGELGAEEARRVLVLLGHIDTVPGEIPVRFERVSGGGNGGNGDDELLHGRGTVDAKGPLATFTVAASRLSRKRLREDGVRVVVVGAVEEESATSRGARAVRDRFDGSRQPIPSACVIGEPSRAHRVTLGYKGRLLLEARAEQELAHTAGPDPGIGVQIVELWNLLEAVCVEASPDGAGPFDRVQPSLRALRSGLDDGFLSWAEVELGLRLPLGLDVDALIARLVDGWTELAARREHARPAEPPPRLEPSRGAAAIDWSVGSRRLTLRARGYEPAWKGDRSNELVRSFQRAVREVGQRPGFVVKTGTSDLNVVGPAWKCPILAYGPGDSALDHTPHEHVSVRELELATDVLERALGHLLTSWRQAE